MPGNVIKVKRREKLGILERLYLPMIVQGLVVTSVHFFRNLRGFVTGKNRTDFVVQYPEEQVDYPDGASSATPRPSRSTWRAACSAACARRPAPRRPSS
jgi:hypothetical protein